ncbi:hypothetical protein IQ06DRAFT_7848 [Phaeosphaeriaceae sp. SRC1lsM3a]|nr:hypothetical protein IQ06DRAFT_7848 [Stagonospora sp. SRC1lsM3a]
MSCTVCVYVGAAQLPCSTSLHHFHSRSRPSRAPNPFLWDPKSSPTHSISLQPHLHNPHPMPVLHAHLNISLRPVNTSVTRLTLRACFTTFPCKGGGNVLIWWCAWCL